MTFQVSDIQVTSKRPRRLALIHGILSFGFNAIIVALAINLLQGLQNNIWAFDTFSLYSQVKPIKL